jgi:flavin reductase (NADH)
VTNRSRRPIQATIHSSDDRPEAGLGPSFREAMAQWASGVAVLAASDGEEIDALTVTAFAALSVDPPLVLAAIGEQSSILPMLRDERTFTISILTQDQRIVASAIAQRLPGSEAYFEGPTDPSVRDAVATLDCTLAHDYDGGDHRIIVGRVERISLGPESEPLVHFRRDYRSLR